MERHGTELSSHYSTERNLTVITLFYGTERNCHNIILWNGTERNCHHIILWNGTELSSHYSTERNGTNTFFAGENITACNSNPMNPTEYPSNELSFKRIRRVVNDQNVHKTV